MKTKFLSILAIAAVIFTSCSDDDSNPAGPTTPTNQNLAGNLTENLTLDPAVEYKMTGAVLVKSGVTLTIPAGTRIEAIAGGTDVYLLVERGGKIIADGTAEAPIVFTSAATTPAAGDWGGIIINGKAPISRQNGAMNEAATEINNAIMFGGDNVSDNSGVLDYVIIEYTGARIDDSAEHNGLTLNGVGNQTTISNIMIKNGDDDGIEFFGGTVNVTNILVVNATDDMFDFSQGYRGTVTNAYGVREAGYTAITSDPRGIEADGNLDGDSPTDINQSDFTINGLTLINKGASTTDATMQDVIKVRRHAKATITNAYAMYGTGVVVGDLIDLKDSKGDADEATSITITRNMSNGLDTAPVKNTTIGGATITVNETQTGANTAAFAWTNYAF